MIIRAHELKRGDIFKKQGLLFLVYFKDDKQIQYHNYYEGMDTVSGSRGQIGANSQERVEFMSTKMYTREFGKRNRKKKLNNPSQ